MRGIKSLLLVVVLMAFGVACAQSENGEAEPTAEADGELSLEIGSVPEKVEGNVLTMPVTVDGIEIVKADGDTSGETGHFHVFIDKEPVDEGEVIAKEAGIVHSAENPIMLTGLSVGEHELTVVVGDGTHTRIGDVEDSVTVDVEGPSVDLSGPAAIEEGDDLELELSAEGVEIVKADGERSKDTGHFHVLVDQEPPDEDTPIPAAVENKIIHTPDEAVTVSGLEKGEHTIWLILGDGQHYPWEPPVMDKLTVTVG